MYDNISFHWILFRKMAIEGKHFELVNSWIVGPTFYKIYFSGKSKPLIFLSASFATLSCSSCNLIHVFKKTELMYVQIKS